MGLNWFSLDQYGLKIKAIVASDGKTMRAIVEPDTISMDNFNLLYKDRLSNMGFENYNESGMVSGSSLLYGDVKKNFPQVKVVKVDDIKSIVENNNIISDEFENINSLDEIEQSYAAEGVTSFSDFLHSNLVPKNIINSFLDMEELVKSEININDLNNRKINNDLSNYVKDLLSKCKSKCNNPDFLKKGMLDCAIPQYLQYIHMVESKLEIPNVEYSEDTISKLEDLISKVSKDYDNNQLANFGDRKMRSTGAYLFLKLCSDPMFMKKFKQKTTEEYVGNELNSEYDIRLASLTTGQFNSYRYQVVKEFMADKDIVEEISTIWSEINNNINKNSFSM